MANGMAFQRTLNILCIVIKTYTRTVKTQKGLIIFLPQYDKSVYQHINDDKHGHYTYRNVSNFSKH